MQLSPKMQGEEGGESISVRAFEQGPRFERSVYCYLKISDDRQPTGWNTGLGL